MHTCMATKTISIDLEAYECLRRARLWPGESFSKVIKRAEWTSPPRSAAALLEGLEGIPPLDPDILRRLDDAQTSDAPPEDPWSGG
jgi:hypothetical protein